ncbi:MAG: hypothetical protein Q8M92_03970 [Candidatus Subteraquimicrobiales bacterium]|nr:hypothetical protein [Candidatus Subteraquimicrobiales bacterium]
MDSDEKRRCPYCGTQFPGGQYLEGKIPDVLKSLEETHVRTCKENPKNKEQK